MSAIQRSAVAVEPSGTYATFRTNEGPLRVPRGFLLAAWDGAAAHCRETAAGPVVDCFESFPSLPVEAALLSRTRGDNTLFWMLLRRLDVAHAALHGADSPDPDRDARGFSARMAEYGAVFTSALFLLAASHQLSLAWNANVVAEKLLSHLSARTLPLIFDAVARFRPDCGEGGAALLAAYHNRYAREGWRYGGESKARMEAADYAYSLRAAQMQRGARRDPNALPSPPMTRSGSDGEAAEAALVAALEAQVRSLARQLADRRERNATAFAAAQELRLAEVEECLAMANNRVGALEAGLVAGRGEPVSESTGLSAGQAAGPRPRLDPAARVYAAAMEASRDDLRAYLESFAAALAPPRPADELGAEARALYELAAEREAGRRDGHERQLGRLSAQSREEERAIAATQQRIAAALEELGVQDGPS